jgi:hypothetical protein
VLQPAEASGDFGRSETAGEARKVRSMKKHLQTLRIAFTLIMARTFGEYKHSGWNGDFHYARYKWRGKEWCIPTSPYEEMIAS